MRILERELIIEKLKRDCKEKMKSIYSTVRVLIGVTIGVVWSSWNELSIEIFKEQWLPGVVSVAIFLYLVEYQYNKILKLISSCVALSTIEVEKMQESYLTNVDAILIGVPTIISAYALGVIFYLKVLIHYL